MTPRNCSTFLSETHLENVVETNCKLHLPDSWIEFCSAIYNLYGEILVVCEIFIGRKPHVYLCQVDYGVFNKWIQLVRLSSSFSVLKFGSCPIYQKVVTG